MYFHESEESALRSVEDPRFLPFRKGYSGLMTTHVKINVTSCMKPI